MTPSLMKISFQVLQIIKLKVEEMASSYIKLLQLRTATRKLIIRLKLSASYLRPIYANTLQKHAKSNSENVLLPYQLPSNVEYFGAYRFYQTFL